ncbi:MAG: hypothetical protein ACYSSN_01415, partial [Planctomycetota bacterium]
IGGYPRVKLFPLLNNVKIPHQAKLSIFISQISLYSSRCTYHAFRGRLSKKGKSDKGKGKKTSGYREAFMVI